MPVSTGCRLGALWLKLKCSGVPSNCEKMGGSDNGVQNQLAAYSLCYSTNDASNEIWTMAKDQDYMLFDPFINGVADLHDRHQDMRLDVDNMPYEELLALEERIEDVKMG
ncbi:hypothetical protein Tco_0827997 [Tanacetum coccineum]